MHVRAIDDTKGLCPRSADLVGRAVFISMSPVHTDDDVDTIVEGIHKVGEHAMRGQPTTPGRRRGDGGRCLRSPAAQRVRSYRPDDREAVYEWCLSAGNAGADTSQTYDARTSSARSMVTRT